MRSRPVAEWIDSAKCRMSSGTLTDVTCIAQNNPHLSAFFPPRTRCSSSVSSSNLWGLESFDRHEHKPAGMQQFNTASHS